MNNDSLFPRALPSTVHIAEDLLHRKPFSTDFSHLEPAFQRKRILVTGAAGSLGTALCETLARLPVERLILLDNNESGLHDLVSSLEQDSMPSVQPILGDILDVTKVSRVFASEKPDVVFHMAGFKHVGLLEKHPEEGVRVNVQGTALLTRIAERHGTAQLVAASTDKAVAPVSIMGATKRIAEEWMRAFSADSRIAIKIIRLCNIFGSRGSMVPKVVKQVQNGATVTVSDPRMMRYFVTSEEAVGALLHVVARAPGSGTFAVLPPNQTSVLDLVEAIIQLHGYEPGRQIGIRYSGPGPGEKLEEARCDYGEQLVSTELSYVFGIATSTPHDHKTVDSQVAELLKSAPTLECAEAAKAIWQTLKSLGALHEYLAASNGHATQR